MSEENKPYRVLARKYRPQNFDELIGQDALVRTLKNAISSGRIAHAFMLTGVRGVGKTTTARIIAKALNYKDSPTSGPTDDCRICRAISEDRHPDVIEMDAASRTGVDDIREILDGVRYAPMEARYKIYVIDEVHMLSKNAFNALLKTLEEPPEHVKFIFATTEINKVPITVLSRCQRFDLQRVSVDILVEHYLKICALENVEAEKEAISMIARAADGSVRDGLSLLDQAMTLSNGNITTDQVKDMLGLSDRTQNLDLLEKALCGDIKSALDIMGNIYNSGGSALAVIQDLLELTHLLTKLRAVPDLEVISKAISPDQLARAKELSKKLSMPSLGKAWQILLKGLEEINFAPNPQNAAEMVVIRLAYAADLPDPADLIKAIKNGDIALNSGVVSSSGSSNLGNNTSPIGSGNLVGGDMIPSNMLNTKNCQRSMIQPISTSHSSVKAIATDMAAAPELSIVPNGDINGDISKKISNLEDIVSLLEENEEFLLANEVVQYIQLVRLREFLLEFSLAKGAPSNLPSKLKNKLKQITGNNWNIVLNGAVSGAPTLYEAEQARILQEMSDVEKMPIVANILKILPEAKLTQILKTSTSNSNDA